MFAMLHNAAIQALKTLNWKMKEHSGMGMGIDVGWVDESVWVAQRVD